MINLFKKLLFGMLFAVSAKTSPYICDSTLNGQIYVKRSLEKRLLILIKSHSKEPVFWPYLVSNHGKPAVGRYEQTLL